MKPFQSVHPLLSTARLSKKLNIILCGSEPKIFSRSSNPWFETVHFTQVKISSMKEWLYVHIAVIEEFGGVEFFTLYFSHKDVMESFWNLLEYVTKVQGDDENLKIVESKHGTWYLTWPRCLSGRDYQHELVVAWGKVSVVDRIKILCMSKPTSSCLLVGSLNRLQREFMHLQWREKLL